MAAMRGVETVIVLKIHPVQHGGQGIAWRSSVGELASNRVGVRAVAHHQPGPDLHQAAVGNVRILVNVVLMAWLGHDGCTALEQIGLTVREGPGGDAIHASDVASLSASNRNDGDLHT